jgi:hypothetical protein
VKRRKHHNNVGLRTVKTGKTRQQVEAIAKRLGVPFGRLILEDKTGLDKKPDEPTGEVAKQ